MRILKSLVVAAALVVAAPAWAHGGHGHDRHDRHDRHGGWHGERHHAHRHHYQHRHHARSFEPRYYSNYYYPPQPVYAAPAPGVHIVVPNIYIPIR
jgi:hypothetical protein